MVGVITALGKLRTTALTYTIYKVFLSVLWVIVSPDIFKIITKNQTHQSNLWSCRLVKEARGTGMQWHGSWIGHIQTGSDKLFHLSGAQMKNGLYYL